MPTLTGGTQGYYPSAPLAHTFQEVQSRFQNMIRRYSPIQSTNAKVIGKAVHIVKVPFAFRPLQLPIIATRISILRSRLAKTTQPWSRFEIVVSSSALGTSHTSPSLSGSRGRLRPKLVTVRQNGMTYITAQKPRRYVLAPSRPLGDPR